MNYYEPLSRYDLHLPQSIKGGCYQNAECGDWLYWGDIARIYGCTVIVDNDLYRNGYFDDFCGTLIFKPKGYTYEKQEIRPKLDVEDYVYEFHKLTDISQERYHPRIMECLEKKIKELQYMLSREQVAGAYADIKKNGGRLVIPDGVREVHNYMYYDHGSLKSVDIPTSVKTICWAAFYKCTGLTSIVLPNSIEDIDVCAFSDCTSLKDVTLPANADISYDAFQNTPFEEEFLEILDQKR